jgi:hypothetical protein
MRVADPSLTSMVSRASDVPFFHHRQQIGRRLKIVGGAGAVEYSLNIVVQAAPKGLVDTRQPRGWDLCFTLVGAPVEDEVKRSRRTSPG